MAKVIDANLFIRLLINDDPKKALNVQKLFQTSKERLIVPDVVIAEVIWLLLSFYKKPKEEIIKGVASILSQHSFQFNQSLFERTFSIWQKHNIDFIDAFLAASTIEDHLDGVYSYDRHLDKVKEIKRLEP